LKEFELIGRIRREAERFPLPPEVRLGIGDDCCAVQPLCTDELVLSTDAMIEDVHFRLDYFSLRQVGARAAAAALSDLAAMAASPLGMLASVALPKGDDEKVRELTGGLLDVASRFGCPLIGGDLTASTGPLMISLTVIGKAPSGEAVLRSGALPGHEIWVTGTPGEAAAVLEFLELERQGKAGGLPRPDEAALERFFTPLPRIPEARFLFENGPPAALIDISDGLAGDLGHILEASGVGAELEGSSIPSGGYSARLARALGHSEHHFLLHGGEDYELCLTAPEGLFGRLPGDFEKRFGLALSRIGVITDRKGHLVLRGRDGECGEIHAGGYEHFS